ncbi:MAG: gluconate 2-dehydrogenase subunit 3 family protein [Deltaproteobacteria bacterium]|nr:gluconate 2-dehydrogenase subunit 3 family protein [Deltaproteobacteria bacterium]
MSKRPTSFEGSIEVPLSAPSRRTFLHDVTKGAALLSVLGVGTCEAKSKPPTKSKKIETGPHGKNVDAFTWRILDAAQDALLPAGGPIAGAREVNAIMYLDLALENPRFKWPKKRLLKLASALDENAQKKHKQTFSKLKLAERDALLHDATKTKEKRNVRLLLDITLEATLSDPVHGGNEKEKGWKSAGVMAPWPRPSSRETIVKHAFPT